MLTKCIEILSQIHRGVVDVPLSLKQQPWGGSDARTVNKKKTNPISKPLCDDSNASERRTPTVASGRGGDKTVNFCFYTLLIAVSLQQLAVALEAAAMSDVAVALCSVPHVPSVIGSF